MQGHVTSSYRSAALGRPFALALVRGGRERIGETRATPTGSRPRSSARSSTTRRGSAVTASVRELALAAQVDVRGEAPAGFPVEPNTTAAIDGRTVLWLGPDEWLVLGGARGGLPGRGSGGRRLGEPASRSR